MLTIHLIALEVWLPDLLPSFLVVGLIWSNSSTMDTGLETVTKFVAVKESSTYAKLK